MAVATAFGLRSCKNQHCTSGLKLAVNPDLDTKNVYDVRIYSICAWQMFLECSAVKTAPESGTTKLSLTQVSTSTIHVLLNKELQTRLFVSFIL